MSSVVVLSFRHKNFLSVILFVAYRVLHEHMRRINIHIFFLLRDFSFFDYKQCIFFRTNYLNKHFVKNAALIFQIQTFTLQAQCLTFFSNSFLSYTILFFWFFCVKLFEFGLYSKFVDQIMKTFYLNN